MRTRLSLCLLVAGSCVASPGCEVAANVARTVCFEVTYQTTEICDCIRNRHLADQAWGAVCQGSAGGAGYSKDYELGFKDGFADFLYDGRCYRPAPPHRYACSRYETPEGQQAFQDWYRGYELGVDQAKQSGLRQYVLVPPEAIAPHQLPPPMGYSGLYAWQARPPAPPGPPGPGPLPVIPAVPETPAPPPMQQLPAPRPVKPAGPSAARAGRQAAEDVVLSSHPSHFFSLAARRGRPDEVDVVLCTPPAGTPRPTPASLGTPRPTPARPADRDEVDVVPMPP
jgi:hypothetical protein